MSRIGKSIETQSRLVVAGGWGKEEGMNNGYGFPLGNVHENVLELDRDSYTIL